jgi:hypothetical protein
MSALRPLRTKNIFCTKYTPMRSVTARGITVELRGSARDWYIRVITKQNLTTTSSLIPFPYKRGYLEWIADLSSRPHTKKIELLLDTIIYARAQGYKFAD